jgi:iron(III) transport system substrate-binding protein
MQRPLNRRAAAALIGAAAAAPYLPARAQDAGRAARDLATYQGADRHDKLVELAKKEGELSIYHVYPALPAVIAAFTKKYGIKTRVWRSGSEAVLQRLVTENRGNRFDVDVVQNNAPENEAAWREKLLQDTWSAAYKDLMPAAVPAHHGWAGLALDIWTSAYNTNQVKKEELPKNYADLQDPRWKGKLAIEANNHAWYGQLLSELGEEAGAKIFANIMATNGMSARKGHSVLANLVASGDVAMGITVYSWIPEQLKKKGAPIENHVIQPLLAQPSTLAIARRAPNPASAILFYDFMLGGEGQKVLADNQFVPTSRLLPGPLAGVPVKLIDPVRALEMQDKWLKTFDEAIIRRAR